MKQMTNPSKTLKFIAKNHKYESTDESEKIEWTSVTSVIALFKEPFNSKEIATKCSKNKKSKWYGLSVKEILNIWENEAQSAIELGSWYHDQREADVLELSTITRDNVELPVYSPIIVDDVKYAPDQKIGDGIYPEHFAYLKSAGICGQADRVEVVNGYVNIYDYKTNKEIKEESYVNWEGMYKMMSYPIEHLMDCNLVHYNLQLSIYMYMILKHNPKLKPGKLEISHIKFKSEYDEFNNRTVIRDENGNPIVEEIVPYELPYLKNEVIAIINYIKQNPEILKSKKK